MLVKHHLNSVNAKGKLKFYTDKFSTMRLIRTEIPSMTKGNKVAERSTLRQTEDSLLAKAPPCWPD